MTLTADAWLYLASFRSVQQAFQYELFVLISSFQPSTRHARSCARIVERLGRFLGWRQGAVFLCFVRRVKAVVSQWGGFGLAAFTGLKPLGHPCSQGWLKLSALSFCTALSQRRAYLWKYNVTGIVGSNLFASWHLFCCVYVSGDPHFQLCAFISSFVSLLSFIRVTFGLVAAHRERKNPLLLINTYILKAHATPLCRNEKHI